MEHYERETLYKEIWEEPMTSEAKRYGVSSNALLKTCRKLNIPVPGRGYWARKAHGYTAQIPPLPKASKDTIVFRYKSDEQRQEQEKASSDPEFAQIDQLRDTLASVGPADKVLPLSRASQAALRRAKADDRKILHVSEPEMLDIRVSKTQIERAVALFDRFIRMAESVGAKVECAKERQTYFVAHEQRVQIALLEKVKQLPPEPSDQQRPWYDRPRQQYMPLGALSFEFQGYFREGLRKTWRDSEHRKLEEILPDVIIGLMKLAIGLRKEDEERKERARKRALRETELVELERAIQDERKRIEKLIDEAQRWRTARLIRDYVTTASSKAPVRCTAEEFPEWREWALAQADRIDPSCPNPPSIVDKQHEVEQMKRDLWRLSE